mmetsp:Transcript_17879/g.69296  ORF Transcript_17879/g.69296 Transcript_17879/m.69296 type:complete len:341 (+) Transcript_17879:2459-3481(+)
MGGGGGDKGVGETRVVVEDEVAELQVCKGLQCSDRDEVVVREVQHSQITHRRELGRQELQLVAAEVQLHKVLEQANLLGEVADAAVREVHDACLRRPGGIELRCDRVDVVVAQRQRAQRRQLLHLRRHHHQLVVVAEKDADLAHVPDGREEADGVEADVEDLELGEGSEAVYVVQPVVGKVELHELRQLADGRAEGGKLVVAEDEDLQVDEGCQRGGGSLERVAGEVQLHDVGEALLLRQLELVQAQAPREDERAVSRQCAGPPCRQVLDAGAALRLSPAGVALEERRQNEGLRLRVLLHQLPVCLPLRVEDVEAGRKVIALKQPAQTHLPQARLPVHLG